MTNSTPFFTSTAELFRKYQHEKNVVTKADYRRIIGNRIDRAFLQKEVKNDKK